MASNMAAGIVIQLAWLKARVLRTGLGWEQGGRGWYRMGVDGWAEKDLLEK